ncbi:MAG: energy transducer TonB, partial [Flavobacteriales bacterium]|nr:energy transducer TonB [Flavobacteriales bacterium]
GVPAYLCKDQGRVAIRVTVERDGSVRKAELDRSQSHNVDDCMLEQALSSAKRTRFNASSGAPDPQTGTVFFLFLPQ